MKRLSAVLLIGMMVLGLAGVAAPATITTTAFPLYVDGRAENVATPFAVHVTISDWTAVAGSDANVRVTITSGAHFKIWNGSEWKPGDPYMALGFWFDIDPNAYTRGNRWYNCNFRDSSAGWRDSGTDMNFICYEAPTE